MTFKEVTKKSSNPRSCLELALEAERVCKTTRDYQTAIRLFRQSLVVGTDDITVLSAIYSQLGNAYFYEHDFLHALEFYRWDLSLSRQTDDLHGEAKACANLSICFKMLDKYPEAVLCAKRQLEICRRINDKMAIARALCNLGNAYYSRGRQFHRFSGPDHLGELTDKAKQDQEMALVCFKENLALVCEMNDRPAEGRAYGNLGNVHYLLGNFRETVDLYKKRLQIAKEFGDLRAQRRAYSNLGNAYIFLGDFTDAARSYKHALGIARQLGDETLQAQACFSLGHSCTLLRDYAAAVVYYLRHLHTAWETGDRVGLGRCHWSLANVYAALGDYRRALRSSLRHKKVSSELNDEIGLLAADLMISELHRILGDRHPYPHAAETPASSTSLAAPISPHLQEAVEARTLEQVLLFDTDRCRQDKFLTVPPSAAVIVSTMDALEPSPLPTEVVVTEVEELNEEELDTELSIATNAALSVQRRHRSDSSGSDGGGGRGSGGELISLSDEEEEDLVVAVPHCEAERNAKPLRLEDEAPHQSVIQSIHAANQPDSSELLLDLLFRSQSLRMNDQRCDLESVASGNAVNINNNGESSNGDGCGLLRSVSEAPSNAENDSFLDLLINLQGARMNDQRADFPGLIRTNPLSNPSGIDQFPTAFGITHPMTEALMLPTTRNGGDTCGGEPNFTTVARSRSASDGLAETEQAPSAADELAPGDDFFDMIFRLQQKTRINDQRSILPPTHHRNNQLDRALTANRDSAANGHEGDAESSGGSASVASNRLLRVFSVPTGRRRRWGGTGGGGSRGGRAETS